MSDALLSWWRTSCHFERRGRRCLWCVTSTQDVGHAVKPSCADDVLRSVRGQLRLVFGVVCEATQEHNGLRWGKRVKSSSFQANDRYFIAEHNKKRDHSIHTGVYTVRKKSSGRMMVAANSWKSLKCVGRAFTQNQRVSQWKNDSHEHAAVFCKATTHSPTSVERPDTWLHFQFPIYIHMRRYFDK